jgi:hypothetical protein
LGDEFRSDVEEEEKVEDEDVKKEEVEEEDSGSFSSKRA